MNEIDRKKENKIENYYFLAVIGWLVLFSALWVPPIVYSDQSQGVDSFKLIAILLAIGGIIGPTTIIYAMSKIKQIKSK